MVDGLPIRIVTYNIQHGADIDHKVDLERTAAQIRELKPDVAMLEEVDINWKRSGYVDQPEFLRRSTGLHYGYFAATLNRWPLLGMGQPAHYGIMLLSRFPIVQADSLMLPRESLIDEPRVLLTATLETPAGPLYVFGTHLTLRSDERRKQIAAILEISKDKPPLRVLLGDFNARPDSTAIEELTTAKTADGKPIWVDSAAADANPQATFPSNTPTARIDYVFLSPALTKRLSSVSVVDSTVSDHRPLLVELNLPAPPSETKTPLTRLETALHPGPEPT